jgi:hypothetical protein
MKQRSAPVLPRSRSVTIFADAMPRENQRQKLETRAVRRKFFGGSKPLPVSARRGALALFAGWRGWTCRNATVVSALTVATSRNRMCEARPAAASLGSAELQSTCHWFPWKLTVTNGDWVTNSNPMPRAGTLRESHGGPPSPVREAEAPTPFCTIGRYWSPFFQVRLDRFAASRVGALCPTEFCTPPSDQAVKTLPTHKPAPVLAATIDFRSVDRRLVP